MMGLEQIKMNIVTPKNTVQISVRKLVEYRRRTGNLDLTFFSGVSAMEGIRLHKKIQESRPEEYSQEFPVSMELDFEDVILNVSGRIDGVFEYPDQACVEEIKSTRKDLDNIDIPEDHVFWAQVKCYGYLYALQKGLENIILQLTLCNVDTGKIHEVKKAFTTTELGAFFHVLVDACLQKVRAVNTWRFKRDQTITLLDFPFETYRTGQRQMAVTVYRVIRDNGQAIIQAPTGIGKTIATLYPALKAMNEGFAEKIFYLTARTTGRSAAESALKLLKNSGLNVKSVTITAKSKICFNPDRLCNAQECAFARGYYDRINAALDELFEQDLIDRDRLESVAAEYGICPFDFTLEACDMADVIICDYNYAFDPRVYLKQFFLNEKKDYVFLVDEAHNLVDRGREMFSASIERSLFVELLCLVRPNFPKISKILGHIIRWFSGKKTRISQEGGFWSTTEVPEDILALLGKFVQLSETWLIHNPQSPFRQKIIDVYFDVSCFIKIAGHFDQTYATIFENFNFDIRLKFFCLDPAGPLEKALKRCSAAVFFSATMAPVSYFKKVLGCRESTMDMLLLSPFPEENCMVAVFDRISTLYKKRSETRGQLAKTLTSLFEQKCGNYLFFFPSYQYLNMVLEPFKIMNEGIRILVQQPDMGEVEREKFIESFKTESCGTLVGFAVMGGFFAEAIDLVGDCLSAAAIIGVGIPMICPERELIRRYYQQKFGAGFDFAYKYPGMNRVLQAAGRVIRSETDKGVILLIDERFSKHDYASLLPNHWNTVRVKSHSDFHTILKKFW
jgi:DNA excision repair protein ERCC-2